MPKGTGRPCLFALDEWTARHTACLGLCMSDENEDPIQKARRLRQASAAIRQSLHDAAERLHLVRAAVVEQHQPEVPGEAPWTPGPPPEHDGSAGRAAHTPQLRSKQ